VDEIVGSLVDYVDGLTYADLAPAVVESVRVRMVDSLGCLIGGSVSPPAAIARRFARGVSGDPGASVLGNPAVSALDAAAFANTVMLRYLDFNDSAPGGGHFSDMIPALLAVAESVRADGRSLVVAVASAYEIAARLAGVTRIRLRGWDNATYLNVAVALAAGKLLGLSREQLGHAAGIAAISNNSTWASREGAVSMWKACASASADRHGIFAALLAGGGMTGPVEPFTGRNGIMELITGQKFTLDFPPGGSRMAVTQSAIKRYPCQDDAQGPIEMALSVRDQVDVSDIESIRVESFHIAYAPGGERIHPEKWDPQTREMADHSLPYLVCVALVDGAVTLDSFARDRYLDPGLRPLMDTVTVTLNEDFRRKYPGELNSTLTIRSKDGGCARAHITFPHGHPMNPLSAAELDTKFAELAGKAEAPPGLAGRIRDWCWAIEDMGDIGAFGPVFRDFSVADSPP
jgi:2-methylcitrate dehydratase